MSNQAVGPLYQTIIEEVIAASRVDFEENGIEENVLEELRQVSRIVPCLSGVSNRARRCDAATSRCGRETKSTSLPSRLKINKPTSRLGS